MSTGLFTPDTIGFGVGLPTGPKTHWLCDAVKSLSKPWRMVRYEEDGVAIHMVVEFDDGDRERVTLRDAEGNYKW